MISGTTKTVVIITSAGLRYIHGSSAAENRLRLFASWAFPDTGVILFHYRKTARLAGVPCRAVSIDGCYLWAAIYFCCSSVRNLAQPSATSFGVFLPSNTSWNPVGTIES